MRPASKVAAEMLSEVNIQTYNKLYDIYLEYAEDIIQADRAALVAEIVEWLDATKREASEVGDMNAFFWVTQIKRDIIAKWGTKE